MCYQFDKNMLINGENLNGLKLIEGLVQYDLVLIEPPTRKKTNNVMDTTKSVKDEWITNIEERMKKAHSAMKKDGAIAVRIDNTEYATLRVILDAVFGEENYVNTFILKRGIKKLNRTFDFWVIYKKSDNFYFKTPMEDSSLEKYDSKLEFVRTQKNSAQYWVAPAERILMGTDMENASVNGNQGNEKHGVDKVGNLDTIKKIISLFTDRDSKILDFYADSGTTGEAVMELNAEDGGSRQFTLMTDDEDGICSTICKPHIDEVARKNDETYQYILIN